MGYEREDVEMRFIAAMFCISGSTVDAAVLTLALSLVFIAVTSVVFALKYEK